MSDITVPSAEVKESVYDLFFSHVPNSNFVFPNGEVAIFVGGRYATDNAPKAAYLQYEIDQGNPHIYRKAECMQVSKSELAPDAEYRKRVIAEYLAKEAADKANKPEMGTSEQGKLNVADTNSVGLGVADSNGAAAGGVAVKIGNIGK